MSPREQAVRFAELLFAARPDGSLIAVSVAPDWDKPRCVRAPADVADYAAGTADVYVRHSPISRRPPKGKRGDERLTAALLGIVLDLDVDGSPDGRGGTVAGACPDRDAALELAHALLEPTLTVNSGYGVTPFYLLDAPLVIAGDDDLDAARALTDGWGERMKRVAGERSMTKLDTVADLARVVRVPGSFNTKGDAPVPVQLLDDGGPRHPLERLRSFAAANGRPKPKPAATKPDVEARVRDTLNTYPRLRELALRKGRKPGKGSESEWDFALGCELARAGGTDEEIKIAIALARRRRDPNDPKAGRDDYLDHTVEKVRVEVPQVREAESPTRDEREALGVVLGRRYGLSADDPIVGGVLIGPGEDAIVRLRRKSGAELRLGHLRGLFSARSHTRVASVACRTRFPAFTDKEAANYAQQIIAICELTEADERDLAEEWLGNFYESAGAVVNAKMDTTDERRVALTRRKEAESKLPQHGSVAARTAVILDAGGEVWIPSAALRSSLSPGAPTWRELEAAVAEVDWRREKVELWTKSGGDDRGEHIKVVFYVGQP